MCRVFIAVLCHTVETPIELLSCTEDVRPRRAYSDLVQVPHPWVSGRGRNQEYHRTARRGMHDVRHRDIPTRTAVDSHNIANSRSAMLRRVLRRDAPAAVDT